MNRGLPVLEAARGLDSWRRPEGSRPLGTRMDFVSLGARFARAVAPVMFSYKQAIVRILDKSHYSFRPEK